MKNKAVRAGAVPEAKIHSALRPVGPTSDGMRCPAASTNQVYKQNPQGSRVQIQAHDLLRVVMNAVGGRPRRISERLPIYTVLKSVNAWTWSSYDANWRST